MSHIEHIQFRCLNHEIDEIIARYISPLLNEAGVQQKWDFRVYQHDRLPSDLLMTLTCKTDNPDPEQIEFGIQIVESLKDLGAASHTIWNQLSV